MHKQALVKSKVGGVSAYLLPLAEICSVLGSRSAVASSCVEKADVVK
jgi:hypothetical protein